MNRILSFLSIFVLLFVSYCANSNRELILFPEREAVKKQSLVFFDKIMTGLPQLKKIDFFIKSNNYYSAYIELSKIFSEIDFFQKFFIYFENNKNSQIEKFYSKKGNLTLDNFMDFVNKTGLSKLDLFSLMLYRLYRDYDNNNLSGKLAYNYWNILLKISEENLKSRKTLSKDDYVIIFLTSKIFFLKNKEKYKKIFKKIKKKIKFEYLQSKEKDVK